MPIRDHDPGDGFGEYRELILQDLRELKVSIKEINDKLSNTQLDLAVIKHRATGWGAVSGAVASAVTMGMAYLKGKLLP